ncbi:type I polyketide synthase [Apodospora peruviana]|uniref:Type I polyketide synthase n=1 Tax=Apodospora peruviana TaxID=516989 RepID=A0AAE0I1L9_9PEZI|nr:type I polyketide synthase [Apodospora peruviana]
MTISASPSPSPQVPIAIVGMACRFPGGATSPSKLWNLCMAGKDGWSPIPAERFNAEAWYHPDAQRTGRSHVKGAYFLHQDVSLFDAAFFSVSESIAKVMDPQLRLLLETVYEATEDSGIPIEKLAGSNTSVYTGCFSKDYHEVLARDPELVAQTAFGTGTAMLANRVSHFYDLQGPSFPIDTGCSAGLVALHQGCRSIWAGEADASIACGSNLLLNQDSFIGMSTMGVLGPDGRCFAWDSRAQGFGRGEGVAALVLKPLSTALRDGDRVHAVIRESGLNQDGRTPTISSPSMEAQIKLIQDCYKRAGLDMSETGYVEAHMTGTSAGDPIEAEAIARTFGQSRQAFDPVLVGSVKTNIGHTEPVSGLASVIKTAFALKNGVIPPNLNYDKTNPHIHLDEWHLQVPTALTEWPKEKAFRASINNFGYGGTNAHVIIERPPAAETITGNGLNGHGAVSDRPRVYILSAKDSTAAKAMVSNFVAHIRGTIGNETKPSLSLTDLAYTLAERRSLLPWVVAVPAKNLDDLCDKLESPATKPLHSTRRPARRLGFVFNGQGAQWYGMARELIESYPVFYSGIHKADKILKEYGADWSLHGELLRDENTTRVSEINLAQPMTVAVQLCLVDLLESWGVLPSAVTSHSSGEIAAAYAVGALSFKEALGVVYYRGELALKHQKLAALQGGMLAASLGSDKAEEYLANLTTDGRAVVACINSPGSVTISGDLSAIDEISGRLEKDGVFNRKLKVPMAYHSHHMLNMAQEYDEKLECILSDTASTSWESENVVFASPVTGGRVTAAKVLRSASHWVNNLTNPVLFSQAFEDMCFGADSKDGAAELDLIVEIGAHSTLAGPIRQVLKTHNSRAELPYASCLKRSVDAVQTMQEVVCELIVRSYPVSLESVNFPFKDEVHTFVTDLPSYPWNHTVKYWNEPRISKELRARKFPPHELLGSVLPTATGNAPTWRNFLRLPEIEWLRDHQVDGKVVLPGAAYIAMAIEAARLLTDATEESIWSYRLRNVEILNALVISESPTGVETQFCLRKCNDKELGSSGWYEFDVCSLGGGDLWIDNCRGYVMAETGKQVKVATTRETDVPSRASHLKTGDAQAKDVDINSLFENLYEMGINHGPIFRNLNDSHSAGNKAATNFTIADVASSSPGANHYALHPTTLDSIFQTTYSSLPKEQIKGNMVLPRSIGTMFVPKNLGRQGGDKLNSFTELVLLNKRGVTSNVAVVNDVQGEESNLCFQMHDFFCQAVPRDWNNASESTEPAGICSKLCWERDILHDVPSEIKKSLIKPLGEEEAEQERKRVRASYNYIYDAVSELEEESKNNESWQWHHKLFFNWMKKIVELGESGNFRPGSETWSKATLGVKQMLADELAAGAPTDQLLVRVGEKLVEIIRGDVTPLELMMQGGLLNAYYSDHSIAAERVSAHVAALVELYAVKQPGAKVLEIGGGTGAATTMVLQSFDAKGIQEGWGGSLLGHYTFTDISQGFFAAAREKFAQWESLMDFKQLNIEQDPVEQGFEVGSYDLIVAAMVLHATKNLHSTLSHVRRLLKPGGKLLLIESTQDRLDTQMSFGTLPGWWLGEEPDRKMSPNAPLVVWDRILRETGFSGVDFEMADYEEPEFQASSTILSSAITTAKTPVRGPISIVYTGDAPPEEWLLELCRQIQAQTGVLPLVESLAQSTTDNWQDKICIFTAELADPLVDGIDQVSFERLQSLLVTSRGVLWLSSGSLIDAAHPRYALAQGLLRTLRVEDTSKRYVHLDFEHDDKAWTIDTIPHVIHVLLDSFDESLGSPTSGRGVESEFAVKDSMLHVARIYLDKSQSQVASDKQVDPEPEMQPFHQPGRPLIWETSVSGLLTDLHFTDAPDLAETSVPSGMVELEAKAFGLNFRDVLVALGQLDETLIGHECSGIVTRLGPDTEQSGLKVGDRVVSLSNGRYASTSRAYWTSVAKIPDDMAWGDAASIPTAYATAYHSLYHIARLQKGETVLVHAAAGGFGQACVALALHIGAKVYATCSSQIKRDLLIKEYGLDKECILSSRDTTFAPAIMAATNGKGVDVVVNSLSGAMLKATWDCIARFGRFIEVGKMDLEAGRHIEMTPFRRCAIYAGVDLLQLHEFNGPLTHEALTESVRICHERQIKNGSRPITPITPFSISDIETGMRQMQGGTHMGKLILVPGAGDLVKVISRPRPVTLANADASYLIVGGLTGVGGAIAEWVITGAGAKNLVLVSRKATSHPAAQRLKAQGEAVGCNVQIRDCDVADEDKLVELLSNLAKDGVPPIRGVINGAMVLDDTVLERMRYEQWVHGVRPKIGSSVNLDKHLPKLDFFIMLSSLLGVLGHTSQSNYAAGNAFQDALARHRTRNGQPGVTLDLGVVRSVGYVASREETGDDHIRTRFEKLKLHSMDVPQIVRLVEEAIRDPLRQSSPANSQVIIGLTEQTPEMWEAAMVRDRRLGTLQLASRRSQGRAGGPGTGGDSDVTAALVRMLSHPDTSLGDAAALLVEALANKLADIFNIPVAEIDTGLPLSRYGVDSLVAVELRNWLSSAIRAKVSVFEILQSPSLVEFGSLLVVKSEYMSSKVAPAVGKASDM